MLGSPFTYAICIIHLRPPLQLSHTVCTAFESIACQTTKHLDIMHDRMLAVDDDQGEKIWTIPTNYLNLHTPPSSSTEF